MDWSAWHDQYDVADSWMARRLRTVQAQVRAALSDAPAGGLKVISLCAGEGRDLLDVLAEHPRRDDVRARLVELDPRNTAVVLEWAGRAGLHQVEVVTGDASLIGHYEDMAPADLVLSVAFSATSPTPISSTPSRPAISCARPAAPSSGPDIAPCLTGCR
jgi:ubiquinone/menaquinone biosynthesis C-methylase UbiE